jgi:hypothetical protein
MRRFTASSAFAAALFCAASSLLAPTTPALAKDGRNAAFAGGAAVGVVGGVLLNQALQNRAAAAPVYVEPAPPVQVAYDGERAKVRRLRAACYDGSRKACIRFGMILGQRREREREWRRSDPDFWAWERE